MTKLSIPEKCLENHIGILGKTGSGKTVTAKGIVEWLLSYGERVCVLDPTGVWFGLRTKADGKTPAFSIPIFGGQHADVALNERQGEALGDIIGTTDTSAILDVSDLKVGERTRFFTAFAETLYRKNKGKLYLILDEADCFAPQGKIMSPQAGEMLSATNNLLSRGRSRGLCITMITQRPAKLHKDSLSQVETLITLKLKAPQDRNAVKAWITDCADENLGREVLQSLPNLPKGTGWVWGTEADVLKKTQFPMIQTYDSSAAPGRSDKEIVLKKIDMETIQQKLGDAAKAILAEDPKSLKSEINRLNSQIQKMSKQQPEVSKQDEKIWYQRGWHECETAHNRQLKSFRDQLDAYLSKSINVAQSVLEVKQVPAPRIVEIKKTILTNANLSKAERKILSALAQYPRGRTKKQIALLTTYSANSGSFNTYLSNLRSKNWMTGSSGELRITDEGRSVLGDYDILPQGEELIRHWYSQLGNGGARRILETLANAYPEWLTKEQVGEATGLSSNSGSFNTYLSKLSTLELIERRQGILSASPDLFQEVA